MKKLKDILNSKKFIPTQTEVEMSLPIREYTEKSLFLHNEYLALGYMANFPPTTTLVYCVLAKYANARKQNCFPAYETIARESGITNRQTISTALRILEAFGLIYIRHGKGGHIPNVYVLLGPSNWKELNSGTIETLRKKRRSIKKQPPEYQDTTSRSGTDDTRTPLSESPKEIPANSPLKGVGDAHATDQAPDLPDERLWEKITPAARSMLIGYYSREQILEAARDTNSRGLDTDSKSLRAALKRLDVTPSRPLPGWYS